jgi:hypothetical protein
MPRCAVKKSLLLSWLFLGSLVCGLHAQNTAPPTITSVSPSQASPASNIVQVTIEGTDLLGATANSFGFSPSGIAVSSVQVAQNGDVIAADFNVCGALPGGYNLTITTGGGTSARVPVSGKRTSSCRFTGAKIATSSKGACRQT